MAISLVSYQHDLLKSGIQKMGVHLPTILVIGDDRDVKSQLLESLGKLKLREGDKIQSTRPLLIRYQNHEGDQQLEVVRKGHPPMNADDNVYETIIKAESEATEEEVITLMVKNRYLSDLLVMDLPAMDILEDENAILDMMANNYGVQGESVVLNLISAITTDVSTCKSFKWCKMGDNAYRTLHIVSMLQGSGHDISRLVSCLREEAKSSIGCLFVTKGEGENIDEFQESYPDQASMLVGVDLLADRIVQIQSALLVNYLPNISKEIEKAFVSETISHRRSEPIRVVMDVYFEFIKNLLKSEIASSIKKSLKDLKNNLLKEVESSRNFLEEELKVLGDPHSAAAATTKLDPDEPDEKLLEPKPAKILLLENKMNIVLKELKSFVTDASNQLFLVASKPMDTIPLDQDDRIMALVPDLMNVVRSFSEKVKEDLEKRVIELVDAESLMRYTSNGEVVASSKKLLAKTLKDFTGAMETNLSEFHVESFGMKQIGHLQDIQDVERNTALTLWLNLNTYMRVVITRLVDGVSLYLRLLITTKVNNLLEELIKANILEKPPSKQIKALFLPDNNMGELYTSKKTVEKIIKTLPVSTQRGIIKKI